MDVWKRFLFDLGGREQIFIVGPLYKGVYAAKAPTIFVDGGADFKSELGADGNAPCISVGDGDSASVPMDLLLPKEKDLSDLAAVMRSLPPIIRHVELLGFLGGRRDHELVNFGEAHLFLKGKSDFTTVRFDESVIGFSGGALNVKIQGEFSVMVLERTAVTITGACKYEISKPVVFEPASSLGLSNVGSGAVTIESIDPCFLFVV